VRIIRKNTERKMGSGKKFSLGFRGEDFDLDPIFGDHDLGFRILSGIRDFAFYF
jgi:hypothetical protein